LIEDDQKIFQRIDGETILNSSVYYQILEVLSSSSQKELYQINISKRKELSLTFSNG
jgi:hypothetical protein